MLDEWLSFRKMLTPYVVQFIFWIGVLGCIVAGGIQIYQGIRSQTNFLELVGFGTFILIVGPLIVRLYCELIVVVFSINSTLTDILKELKGKSK